MQPIKKIDKFIESKHGEGIVSENEIRKVVSFCASHC